jgi:Flp pilus assembly protein TadD
VRFALGLALQQTQQLERAAEEFRRVVAGQPTHAGAYRHLGQVPAHAQPARGGGGRVPLGAGARARFVETHNDLGVALAELGKLVDAEAQFAEAARLDPHDAEARNNLIKVRQLLQRGGRGGVDKYFSYN